MTIILDSLHDNLTIISSEQKGEGECGGPGRQEKALRLRAGGDHQHVRAGRARKKGDKLPNQNELAAQLGVSRASLRESLHTLSITGVLEQRPGFGTVVRGRLPHNFSDFLSLPLISDAKETIELVQARRFIEVANVELAVENATEEEVAELGQLYQAMAAAVRAGDQPAYVLKDAEFHHLLAKATGNRFMVHLFLTIRRIMEQFITESFSALPTMLDRSLGDHKRIYEAIRHRDRSLAIKE
ncbi:MAG: FCD domain-containing protein [Chromatiales bacterium]|nr:FCD domain-containing protein [Chromatiales bacterium]